jgi:hypothetical protein
MSKAALVSHGLSFPSSITTTRWQKCESIAYDANPTWNRPRFPFGFTVLLRHYVFGDHATAFPHIELMRPESSIAETRSWIQPEPIHSVAAALREPGDHSRGSTSAPADSSDVILKDAFPQLVQFGKGH